jgi:hypothetical protein
MFIVYQEVVPDPNFKQEIWVLPMGSSGDHKPYPFLRSDSYLAYGQLSLDSHLMAV